MILGVTKLTTLLHVLDIEKACRMADVT